MFAELVIRNLSTPYVYFRKIKCWRMKPEIIEVLPEGVVAFSELPNARKELPKVWTVNTIATSGLITQGKASSATSHSLKQQCCKKLYIIEMNTIQY